VLIFRPAFARRLEIFLRPAHPYVFFGEEHGEVLSDDLLGVVAFEAFGTSVPAGDASLRPGPRPPYQALIIMAPKISRKGVSCTISGSRSSLIANATPTASMATPYRKSSDVCFIEGI